MIGYTEVKALVGYIGIPATVIIAVIAAFQYGWIPGTTLAAHAERAHEVLVEIQADTTRQHAELIRQHIEATERVVGALKAICFNTAKTDQHTRECGKL